MTCEILTSRKLSGKKASAVVCALLFAVGAITGSASAQKNKPVGRLLLGKVLDQQDNPLPNAVVYLTNSRTRAVKTYIVGADGVYRFPALAANVDYEIYAQVDGKTSDTKKMSQFDDRKQVKIDLRIDAK